MKKLLFLLALIALSAHIVLAQAPTTVPPDPAAAPAWLADLVTRYPWFSTVVVVVGTLRLCLKPAFELFHIIVGVTPTKADDEFLERMEASKAWTWFTWLLNYLTSIKLTK
jgi:hypothetical protein